MEEKEKETKEVGLGSLYDFNKIAMKSCPSLSEDLLKSRETLIAEFVEKFPETKYYMLLCNELKDYTLFNTGDTPIDEISATVGFDVVDCIRNRGAVLDIHLDNNGAVALWIRYSGDGEIHCYYFFPYDAGVIEY